MRKEITGQRFGSLTAVRFSHSIQGNAHWFCRCDCGVEKPVSANALKRGLTKTCGVGGCRHGNPNGGLRHGHAFNGKRTGAYTSWQHMKDRCLNPNHKHFSYYGGRGIDIDDPLWLKFDNFLAAMGDRPSGMTLDRIDNERGYCKANCRWATRKEQIDNRR